MGKTKFRAWDKKAEVMREIKALIWEENNLIAHCPPRGHEYNEWFTVILNGWEYQLMQSTGLKDKNGVEIFEGDVLKEEHGKYVVVWETENARFSLKSVPHFVDPIFIGIRYVEEMDLVGNIHGRSWKKINEIN